MGWGFRSAARPRISKLERLAGKAEQAFLAMPEADRVAALQAVDVIAQAVAGLRHLPDELVEHFQEVVVTFLMEAHIPPKQPPKKLIGQVIKGAPQLLGPHQARIEAMVDAE